MTTPAETYGRLALQATDDFEKVTSPAALMERVARILGTFGYTQFIFGRTKVIEGGKIVPVTFIHGWSPAWRKHYVENKLFDHDPVALQAHKSLTPFEWSEAPYDPEQNPRAAAVMNVASEFGLRQGYAIPIATDHTSDVVSMAGEQVDLDAEAKRTLILISYYAHAKAIGLVGNRPISVEYDRVLTPAERETMSWLAAGKTTWEISVILHLSEAAIFKRINSATRKLNAMNRTHAVARALITKEITP